MCSFWSKQSINGNSRDRRSSPKKTIYKDTVFEFQRKSQRKRAMSRTIWLVRHGQRVDNVDKKWKANNDAKWDDPELTYGVMKGLVLDNYDFSLRGKQQAHEVGKHFANMNIEAIVVSPFTRCIETAAQIVAMMENKAKICVEPGLMEPLYLCKNPPTIPSMDKIKYFQF